MPRVARVLLDAPLPQLDRLLDYAIPPALAESAVPGVRVKAPLRSARRMLEGWIVETGEADADARPLSELDAVVSPVEVLPVRLYALARRVADRAAGSAADVLRLAVPKRMVRAEKAWLVAGAPPAPVVDPDAVAWSGEVLAAFPGLADALAAGERVAVDAPPRVERAARRAPRAGGELGAGGRSAAAGEPGAHGGPAEGGETVGAWALLLAAAATLTLAAGRSALLVVPDHRDQAQLEAALAGRIPPDALVLNDARRPAQERYVAYLRTLDPVPCVVVGNRSTVYAPAHATGLIALWDDGDPLLAEPLSPGVHARDASLVRQELEGSALLLAGHTRTADVERLVALGYVHDVPAARRVTPRVVLSATREGEGASSRVPSAAFAAAREALAGGPVLVQVARPGYAPALVCDDCRRPARCAHCGGPLAAARPGATPECRWCGRQAHAWVCPHCSSTRLRLASSGSERTADELGRAFPGVRVVVADGQHPVARVDERPALVVATRGAEPIADGGYRAVVLLDGERMLLADDLRIGEHALRWWSNAAALAAPGAPVHLVGVTGPVARALATWTQPAYARGQLAERAELRMPPAVRVAALDGDPAAVARAEEALWHDVAGLDPDAVLGPVRDGDDTRAIVRFDYGHGGEVAASLRASVVGAALRARGRSRQSRAPLRVRLDVPDPVL